MSKGKKLLIACISCIALVAAIVLIVEVAIQ
mgnify:CR=1 FL=1